MEDHRVAFITEGVDFHGKFVKNIPCFPWPQNIPNES